MQSTINSTLTNTDALSGIAPKVTQAIQNASARTGVDFSYLMNQARAESNFNPTAKASTSSATGLYQFIESTWLKMIKDHGAEYGLAKEAAAISENPHTHKLSVSSPSMRKAILDLRKDPELASAMAAEFAGDNKEYLEMRVKGRDINSTELYFAHFLGAGGASRFLNKLDANPQAIAADQFPKAALANRNVFYNPRNGQPRTMQQVYDFFDKKFSTDFGDVKTSAPQNEPTTDMIANNGGIAFSPLSVFSAAKAPTNTPIMGGSFLGLAADIKDTNELYISAMLAMPSPSEEKSDDANEPSRHQQIAQKPHEISFLSQRMQNPALLQLLKS